MKFTLRPRRLGKTTAAIKHALDHGFCLLVFNSQERERIIKQYKFPKERIFTPLEIESRLHVSMGHQGFVVDNVDLVLSSWLNREIEGMTLNGTRDEF